MRPRRGRPASWAKAEIGIENHLAGRKKFTKKDLCGGIVFYNQFFGAVQNQDNQQPNHMQNKIMTLALLAATAATPVLADTYQEYEIAYSGLPHGNSATGTGFVTLDLSAFSNPSSPEVQCDIADYISSLTLTISGADSGNGTFTTSDYSGPYGLVYSFLQAVNFNTQLVGQPGFADFNFLNAIDDAPVGDNELDISVDDGKGVDKLAMTSMEPVPEPSTLALSAAGGLGGLLMHRRRK